MGGSSPRAPVGGELFQGSADCKHFLRYVVSFLLGYVVLSQWPCDNLYNSLNSFTLAANNKVYVRQHVDGKTNKKPANKDDTRVETLKRSPAFSKYPYVPRPPVVGALSKDYEAHFLLSCSRRCTSCRNCYLLVVSCY